MATPQRATFVSILAVGFSLSGCADISFGSLGTTQEHSFADARGEVVEPARPVFRTDIRDESDEDAARDDERAVAMRGSIGEAETKLSGLEDDGLRRKPEEIELASRLNPIVVSDGRRLQCVPFVREITGIDIRGNANRWWELARGLYERSRRPEEGSILVMRGWKSDRRGHVAVVKEILDDRTIVIDHANWLNDGKIYLNAPVRDESPKNDWSRVRVWYTPGEQWGHRVYAAKGFIYPTENTAVRGKVGRTFALSR